MNHEEMKVILEEQAKAMKDMLQMIHDLDSRLSKLEPEPDFEDDDDDDYYNDDDDDFDEHDTRYGCKCGAWVVSQKTGKLLHVADCICGAE